MIEDNKGKRIYDDLETDYLEEENESGFLSLISVIVAFLAVAVFIALAWYAYQSSNDQVSMADIEVIYPDEEVIREAPQEAGGWQFPHQDKNVYNMLAGGNQVDVKVEKIMPSTEEPVDRPQMQTQTWLNKKLKNPTIAKTDAERQKDAKKAVVEAVANPVVEKPKEIPTIVEKAVTVKPVKVVKKKPVQTKTVSSSLPTKARVQLGAFRSRSDANAQWAKTRKAHSALISGKSSYIEVIKLKDKGTFYRLQLVPFSGKADAKALCAKLVAKKQPCFVVVK